jgi:hypothetical protein
MPQAVAGVVALVAVALLCAGAVWVWVDRRKRAKPLALPSEWALGPRPVFNTDERRMYRQLREAFPDHVVLCKLPLIRFCHPDDPNELRYWYELLGSLYVSFAVCSENGRVLAAIDIDANPDGVDSKGRRRALQIKQSVLDACRVRYARSAAGQLPTIAELHALMPSGNMPGSTARAPAATLSEARDHLALTVAARRRERARTVEAARDANLFQDSFFSTDARFDPTSPSGFDILSPAEGEEPEVTPKPHGRAEPPAGRVVDVPVLRTPAAWPR